MKQRNKKILIGGIILILFVLYTLALDPDTSILSNLPFGAGVLLSIQVLLMFAIGLAAVEILTDFFTDTYFSMFDDIKNREKIKEDSKALAIYMLGWSIRLFGYAIMFGLIVLAYMGGR